MTGLNADATDLLRTLPVSSAKYADLVSTIEKSPTLVALFNGLASGQNAASNALAGNKRLTILINTTDPNVILSNAGNGSNQPSVTLGVNYLTDAFSTAKLVAGLAHEFGHLGVSGGRLGKLAIIIIWIHLITRVRILRGLQS